MTWLRDSRFISYGIKTKANINYYKLVIPSVQLKHAGTYECLGRDNENHRFLSNGVLEVYGECMAI